MGPRREPNRSNNNQLKSSNMPFAILHHHLAIGGDPAAAAGIDDQVPVEGRLIDSPRLGIALTEREVDRPTDLFVVEDAAGEAIDTGIETETKLAEPAGA